MDATGDVLSVVDPVMIPEVAVMVVEPMFKVAVASPCEPDPLLMFAIPVSDELQVTLNVRFRGMLSEKVPIALSCMTVPGAMLELTGVTDRESNTGGGPV